MKKPLMALGLLLGGMAAAAGNPASFSDCYLRPDLSPSSRATPGTAGGFTSPNLVGSASLRNEGDQPLQVKRAIVHVADGYGQPLFDIGPVSFPVIPPHQVGSAVLNHYYLGAVTVFRFSGDFTVCTPNGSDVTLNLTPLNQTPMVKATNGKLPGY